MILINNGNRNMTTIEDDWLPTEIKIIKMVKQNPIIYKNYPTKTQYKANENIAWDKISLVTNLPNRSCKQLWNSILCHYAKLKIMAETGQVPIETLMSHKKTRKFFNGTLSFLDPYLSKITSARIHSLIHKHYNDLFMDIMPAQVKNNLLNFQEKETKKNNLLNHHDVRNFQKKEIKMNFPVNCHDVRNFQEEFPNFIIEDSLNASDKQYLFNCITDAVKHCKQVLIRNQNNIIITNEISNNSTSSNKTIIDRVKLGLESELIIEDDENNVKIENLSPDHNYDNNNENDTNKENGTTNYVDNCIEINAKECLSSVNNDTNANVNNDNITSANKETSCVSDNDLRKFFNELGVVICNELSIVNQKKLQVQINDLVKNILSEE